jgi:hypothetical protein
VSRLRVSVVVEGHGEVASVPILLERLWFELIRGEYIEVVRPPIRQPRDRLARNKDDSLSRAVGLAAAKLRESSSDLNDPELILVLIDADEDLPCELGPRLLEIARHSRSDKNISCVIANIEYETWFVASAASLTEFLEWNDEEDLPVDPEAKRMGKGWIEKRFKGVKYSETVDQPKLTAKMDLQLCRDRSPSFDKLCRDVEAEKR